MSERERNPYERMTEDAFDASHQTSFESHQAQHRAPRPRVEQRNMATIAHLSALAGYVIPFGSVLGPLVVWLMNREEMPIVGEHARRALNFQLTMLIGIVISLFLIFVVIGIPLLIVLGLMQLVLTIVAVVKANQGEDYRYPYSLEFIK